MVAAAVMGASVVALGGGHGASSPEKKDRPLVIRMPVRWPHCDSCGAADVGEIRCSYCGSLWRIGYRE